MNREEFIQQLADFDDDDVQDLPPQNKKQLDAIMRALTNGEHIPLFQAQKIGSYGDDIINQVMRQTFQDISEVVQLLQSCCFCQSKVHKHILKKAKETLDLQTTMLQEDDLQQQQRIKLFRLLAAFAECGIDNEFRVIRTAFAYFMRQLDVVERKIELLTELSVPAIQKLNLVEFYDANCQIVTILLDLHRSGVLFLQTNEELAGLANCARPPQQIPPELQHLAKWHETLDAVYSRFKSLSAQFREKQVQANREREPTRKNAILQVVKFGGQMMPVIQRFLELSQYAKQLDFFAVLSPMEELEMGNKYYPEYFERISVGFLGYENRSQTAPNMLWSSFSSKAELQFDIQDQFFHDISKQFVSHDPEVAGDQLRFRAAQKEFNVYMDNLRFLQRQTRDRPTFLRDNFTELFLKARHEQEIEALVDAVIQQYEEQQPREAQFYSFVFSGLMRQLVNSPANSRLLAYMVIILYYNNITVFWQISPELSYQAFQGAPGQIPFAQGFMAHSLKGEPPHQAVVLTYQFLRYRVVSTVQYGRLLCGLANRFRKLRDLQGYQTLLDYIVIISQMLERSSVYFILIDSDGFQQIYDNFVEKAVKNLKSFYEGDRSQGAEYIYRRFCELGELMLEKLEAVNQRVEATDERILREQQLAYDLQFRKYKFKKGKKAHIEIQDSVKPKTVKQQKFEDLDTALFRYSCNPQISEQNYTDECPRVLMLFDEAVTASLNEAREEGEHTPTKSQFFVLHLQELFEAIISYTTLASYSNIVFLYSFMFKERMELKKLRSAYVSKVDLLPFGISMILTRAALFQAAQEPVDFRSLVDRMFPIGFKLERVQQPQNAVEDVTRLRAVPIESMAMKTVGVLMLIAELTDDKYFKQLSVFCAAQLDDDTLKQDLLDKFGVIDFEGFDLSGFPATNEHIVQIQNTRPEFLKELEDIDC